MKSSILILDFGSQYNQLIARRVRDLGVYAEVVPCNITIDKIKAYKPIGIILSGGPSSVFAEDAFAVDSEIFNLNIPVLGICYGMQLTAHLLGGKVEKGIKGEYGKSNFKILKPCKIFENISEESIVWMSHFDEVVQVPSGFQIGGKSSAEIASFFNEDRKIYALQFHPEVSHSEAGSKILENFTCLS